MARRLGRLGVNSVALVPYGFAPGPDRPGIRFGGETMESASRIELVAALARARGIKVMLKPQIWLRSGFPGDIRMPDDTTRAQWFVQYGKFLDYYATLAARIHADILCIGAELVHMTRYEADWRNLIARARRVYPGPLTYAATQGQEFESIRFWDALDYIGLNNYYPLPDDLSTVEVVRKVEQVHKRFDKPVIFPEAGFASLKAPHRAPWDESPRGLSPEEQARCYEAVFRAFYRKPWFYGVYWWKVGTNGYGGPADGSHTPWRKPAMDVVARWYSQGGR